MDKICISERNSIKKYSDSGVYLIEIANHKYVGSAKNFHNRWTDHRRKSRAGNAVNQKFQNAWNKYGESQVFLFYFRKV